MCTNMRPMMTEKGFLKYVPCKYLCTECRNMRREDFAQRLKFELKTYNYIGAFVTLTYRDQDLPILLPQGSAIVGKYFGNVPPAFGSTLYPPDLSKFCDNMQKRLKRKFNKSGKYIAFGDYGDDSHRPHMHLIYVGLPVERAPVYDCWKHGNVDVKPITNGRIRYVLDYINKDPIFPDSKFEMYGDFYPPFYHYSKGLGFEEIYKLFDNGAFDEFGKMDFGDSGRSYTLPPYLKTKLGLLTKNEVFPESVVKWSKDKNIPDLYKAAENRSKVVETVNTRAAVARNGMLVDYNKLEIQEMIDRANRFKGFSEYDTFDEMFGLI